MTNETPASPQTERSPTCPSCGADGHLTFACYGCGAQWVAAAPESLDERTALTKRDDAMFCPRSQCKVSNICHHPDDCGAERHWERMREGMEAALDGAFAKACPSDLCAQAGKCLAPEACLVKLRRDTLAEAPALASRSSHEQEETDRG